MFPSPVANVSDVLFTKSEYKGVVAVYPEVANQLHRLFTSKSERRGAVLIYHRTAKQSEIISALLRESSDFELLDIKTITEFKAAPNKIYIVSRLANLNLETASLLKVQLDITSSKLLVLYTWSPVNTNIAYEVSNVLNLGLCKIDYIGCETHIKEYIHSTELSTKQKGLLSEMKTFDAQEQLSNFVYPKKLEIIPGQPEILHDPDDSALDVEQCEISGWLTDGIKMKIPKHSPKLAKVISMIHAANSTGYTVIYSKFHERFGVKLVSTLLNLVGIPNTIYDSQDKQQLEKIILTDNPLLPKIPVSKLYILDSFDPIVIGRLIESIQLTCEGLKIYLFATPELSEEANQIKYYQVQSQEYDKRYQSLWDAAAPLR